MSDCRAVSSPLRSWVTYAFEFFSPAGRLSAESLHSNGASAKSSFIYVRSAASTRRLVWRWIRAISIPQDGLSHSPLCHVANQVMIFERNILSETLIERLHRLPLLLSAAAASAGKKRAFDFFLKHLS